MGALGNRATKTAKNIRRKSRRKPRKHRTPINTRKRLGRGIYDSNWRNNMATRTNKEIKLKSLQDELSEAKAVLLEKEAAAEAANAAMVEAMTKADAAEKEEEEAREAVAWAEVNLVAARAGLSIPGDPNYMI
jgi:hypothetical protein